MQKRLACLTLRLLLAFLVGSNPISAQKQKTFEGTDRSVRIGLALTGLANFNHWQTSEYIDARFRVRPYLSKTYGVVAQKRLTDHWSAEAGASLVYLGLTTALSFDYRPRRRIASIGTGRSSYGMLALPIRAIYWLPQRQRSSRVFVALGSVFFYNGRNKDDQFGQSRSTRVDRVTGDTLTITESFRAAARFNPSVVGAVGWEKRLSPKATLHLGLTGNLGLTPIVQTYLTYSAANQPRFGPPRASTNELVNRGSYLGLELCFLFSSY